MATLAEAFDIALQQHQAGQFEQAEQIYRQILALVPDHFETLHCLGVMNGQLGRYDTAVECLQRALAVKPDSAAAHNDLGNAWKCQDEFAKAVASYRQALELQPDFADACNNLGLVLQDQGEFAEAVTCHRRAVQLMPESPEAHFLLGNALRDQEETTAAATCYRRALEIAPDFAAAHTNLGFTLHEQGRLDEAIHCYRNAVQLTPEFAEGHSNLGNALRDQGQLAAASRCYQRALQLNPNLPGIHNNLGLILHAWGQIPEAVICYQRALQLWPEFADGHNNLGNALRDQGKLTEALACFQWAAELHPDFAEVHCNLGLAWQDQGQLAEAITSYQQAIKLNPELAAAHKNLANALRDEGRLSEAIEFYRRASQLEPQNAAILGELAHQLQQLCQWNEGRDLSQRIINLVENNSAADRTEPCSPFHFLSLPTPTSAAQQQQCTGWWVDHHLSVSSDAGKRVRGVKPKRADARIKLGYLSADFHEHATAHLIAELFEKHDRDRFEVNAYAYGPDDGSPIRQRIKAGVDRFVDLQSTSFTDAAEQIAADDVDILIDLKGYTQHARPQILVLRPAPIQVNYLGYPGTMAASFMDYILVDDFIVPPEQQPYFSEQLVHLPGCYQVNDSQREIAALTPSREACGLPPKGFVFCGFHTSYKITPELFAVWMDLLRETPGSVLWLLERTPIASANLRREAVARGVAEERLVFGPSLPLPAHLARHRLADLFLDTFPVNAHTTASDALWAGCPVLTTAGETFISRVAGSLLRSVGLPELVTANLHEYRALALQLAREPARLAELRTRLDTNRITSGLFDAAKFARNLEHAFVTMSEIYESGEKPRAFKSSPTQVD